jgi:hypothetical protein
VRVADRRRQSDRCLAAITKSGQKSASASATICLRSRRPTAWALQQPAGPHGRTGWWGRQRSNLSRVGIQGPVFITFRGSPGRVLHFGLTECAAGGLKIRDPDVSVLPSRPRPARRSTGRIYISDVRTTDLTCERQPDHTFGPAQAVATIFAVGLPSQKLLATPSPAQRVRIAEHGLRTAVVECRPCADLGPEPARRDQTAYALFEIGPASTLASRRSNSSGWYGLRSTG